MSTARIPALDPIASDWNCERDCWKFSQLKYAVTHVFLPAGRSSMPCSHYSVTPENDLSLARTVCTVAHTHSEVIDDILKPQWCRTTRMLDNLQVFVRSEDKGQAYVSQLRSMQTGDTLMLFSEVRGIAVFFRRQEHFTLCETLETSWDLNKTLKGSYPECAVKIPNEIFHDHYFQSELANFLFCRDQLVKYHGISEARLTYTQLLANILRAVGCTVDVPRITERVRSHYRHTFVNNEGYWSLTLWYLVKVAIQKSLDCGDLGRLCYKTFKLHFMCSLGKDAIDANLSGGILHAISAKILRSLRKLGSFCRNWLRDMVLKISASVQEILDARWTEEEAARSPPHLWKPSQFDLGRDTQLSLRESREYILHCLANQGPAPFESVFHPKHILRGSLKDFLSLNGTFFDEAYRANPYVALYDIEQAVEHGIDDWVACVTDVDQSCAQLDILMEKYLSSARYTYQGNPECISIMFLTMIELWVALDKIVVGAIPTLNHYSPEIPTELLQLPLLRKITNFHRLRCAYQHLSARHSLSFLGQSVFSDEFAKDKFLVRYHVNSPTLRHHIEEYGHAVPSHVDILVFELRCPTSLHVWRSSTARILDTFFSLWLKTRPGYNDCESVPFFNIPRLQPYLVEGWALAPPITDRTYIACLISGTSTSELLAKMFRSNTNDYHNIRYLQYGYFTYQFSPSLELYQYVSWTSHTSNNILAAQAVHPHGLSPQEFISFGHLRSGGSLQWVSILQALRGRTLNLRRRDVHLLLAHAASQVGPLEPHSTEWIWHRELQEPSFCYALLDELEGFFVDVGACSLDGVMVNSISFLVTQLLALCRHEDTLERAFGLLRSVRIKTFEWVRELSYGLMMSPLNIEQSKLLMDMAATCRSTFDVDAATVHRLLCSAADVDALLSCAIFIHAHGPADSQSSVPEYTRLLIERDRRLSLILEDVLSDVVRADASNRGIDIAVRNVWPGFRPGPCRWQQLPHPNPHWLKCETAASGSRRSQIVHLNLLDGTLLVDNKSINRLPHEITEKPTYKRIFGDRNFLVIPSDLLGMDFATLAMVSEHRVHFALHDDVVVIRVQHKDTTDILEVIPQEKLQGDLPPTLVHGHVHWLNLTTSIIEIRPLQKLWEESSENWRIACLSRQYCVYRGRECLVDIRSSTWEIISGRLKCLDLPENLIITTLPTDTPQPESQSLPVQQLSVVLLRYSLSFLVNEDGELESRDFKDMIYDDNQCIGTLFGLENRLVLRSRVRVEEELTHRCVIIPDGHFRLERHGYHVNIKIDTTSAQSASETHGFSTQSITYHTYTVDTDLGCLTGYLSWRSRLFLAHLHAQTSVDWRPDPLTGRSGVQEALRLLRSAGCRSIMKLETCQEEARLPPSPHYGPYPRIRSAMEEIEFLTQRMWPFQDRKSSSSVTPFGPPRVWPVDDSYLFPFEDVQEPMTVETRISSPESSELTDLVYTTSLAVHHWLINRPGGSRVELQDDVRLGDDPVRGSVWSTCLSQAPADWPKPNVASPSIAEVDALLQRATAIRLRFRLLFSLPTIVCCQDNPQPPFLAILVALAKQFPLQNPPQYANCRPSCGYRPSLSSVQECFVDAQRTSLSSTSFEDLNTLAARLLEAPSSEIAPMVSLNVDQDLYDVEKLSSELRVLFCSCYSNLELKEDLTRRLDEHRSKSHTLPNPTRSSRQASDQIFAAHHPTSASGQIKLTELFCYRSPPKMPAPQRIRRCGYRNNRLSSNSDTPPLNHLFASLRTHKTDPPFQQQYITRLHASVQHVCETPHMARAMAGRLTIEELQKHYAQCRDNYVTGLTALKEELGPMDDPLEKALDRSGQRSQITPNNLFRCLASTSPTKLPEDWRDCLVSLALLLVELQRARRLLRFALENLEEELYRELENEGCDGWRAKEYPDWLLIQLEGNFLIRGVQADVAIKTISPPSGGNTAMQVNMGEGKSSVILPISAATLADGNQLVRVIVPKALTVQTFRLLVDRLGGLVNRPIYYLPFTRSLAKGLQLHYWELKHLYNHMSEWIRNRGILVVQPEHVLSFKLTSVEKQLLPEEDDPKPLHPMLELQRWLHYGTRDIMDEMDDVLHPRSQVMYTIGLNQHLQGYPNRWTITQQILRLVRKHALSLARDLPDAIEYELGLSGLFPRIRILRASDARRRLISLIVDDVMDGRLPNFKIQNIDRDRRLHAAIRAFISLKDVFQPTARMVEEYARKTTDTLWDGILLLRGLLACDVLLFALAERRWRVDYGLSPTRTMLAVPYRAKDVPAPRAEFGHPDITIVLTCLSYYYGGLTEEQLRTSFEILQEQDDSSAEYANWLRDHDPDSVPESIRDLKNVNIKSLEQWEKHLFPLFSRNQGAVDLYLSRVVFPGEAREFPWKLAASSWDLAERRERPITGFSGTNDCQDLLPLSIAQRDLNHQRGANARVLTYLLQPENNFYMLISPVNGERRTTLDLLRLVANQEPQIRVFLDVGAQILDSSNYQVAKAWLDLSSGSDGAIYFNEDDELMVLTKDGARRSLISSLPARQLDRCVVYLDDAHTRGTDLKFPNGFRAAVTLGPKVTKDRLVQGCMRMRKLGLRDGHSVMFFAPLEVDGNIRAVAGKQDQSIPITTTDILQWAIHETWSDIQERAPYWAQQGISHSLRCEALNDFCDGELTQKQLADAWLQPELKSLTDLYAPFHPGNVSSDSSVLDNYPEIQEHGIHLGLLKLPEARMEEEQEREVNREIEREREVAEWLPGASLPQHSLHPDVVAFVKTGFIPPLYASSAFQHISTALEGTSAAIHEAHVWSPFILATADFCKTIEPASCQGKAAQRLRPVQFVLSGKRGPDPIIVLLSPFEADCLMPDIRVSEYVHLHLYTPCTSERMKLTNDLMLYSIPPLPEGWTPPWDLIDQLNVFAGQLYLRDYESYLRLRRFLGLQANEPPNNVRRAVRHNLSVPNAPEENANTIRGPSLNSVMMIFAIRRKGLPFAETHMGRILQGQQLTREDFENSVGEKSGRNPVTLSQPSKRDWEMPDPFDVDKGPGRPQKRLRVGH